MLQSNYNPDKYSNRRLKAQLQQQEINDANQLSTLKSTLASIDKQLLNNYGVNAQSTQQLDPLPPKWRKMDTDGWKKLNTPSLPETDIVYPWGKTGYHEQQTGPKPTQQQQFETEVMKSRGDCKTCEVAQPDLVPMGCSITGDGEALFYTGRQAVNHFRPLPGWNTPPIGANPIVISEPNRKHTQNQNEFITPMFDHYDANLYKTPYDRTENLISTGILMNPYNGNLFETFEKQLPPPQTNKYVIPKDQFKRTNPQLVWLNGGIDPNNLPPSKREVMQDVPGPDGGPNVWGTQLYAGSVNDRVKEYSKAEIWNNRNGIYSCEPGFPKEAPAGYVGLQPVLRGIPYLPPTQRTTIDIKGYTGQAFNAEFENLGGNLVEEHGRVETRKIDLNSGGCATRVGDPDGFSGQTAPPVVPIIDPRPTWRGRTDGWVAGAVDVNAADTNSNIGGWVVQDATVKETLKALQEVQRPIMQNTLNTENTGGWVLQDTSVKQTLKALNERQLPTLQSAIGTEGTGGWVLQDTTIRPTLKSLNETQFPIMQNALQTSQYGGWVLQNTTLKPTLKSLQEEQFPITQATALNTIPDVGHTVINTTVRETLKSLSELSLPTLQSPLGVENTGSWVLQDSTIKDTLKSLNEQTLRVAQAQEEDTGSWIPFQGDFRIGPRRIDYSTNVPLTEAHFTPSLSGPSVGPANTTSKQNRGMDQLFWTEPSQIVEDGSNMGSMTRFIGLMNRDTKSEMMPSVPVGNFNQDNSINVVTPRQYPLILPKCQREDDTDDEFLTIRPPMFLQAPRGDL